MSDAAKITTRYGEIEWSREVSDDHLEIRFSFHLEEEVVFHWGLARTPEGPWLSPPEEIRPEKTRPFDDHSVQTPVSREDTVNIRIETGKYAEFPFVLYLPRKNEWDNNLGQNYRISLSAPSTPEKPSPPITGRNLQDIADEIIQKETSKNSWTLMHRYNLCYELLDKIGGSREGLVLLFVWLRFSALRQLDWQRNYNTKPRELSHAQQRLTSRLARLYREEPGQRDLARLMLTTLGHGGEGQRIRDEILEIMHRYRIKEVPEIFMEQWHQKMHNNTTPDDIVICEAYLAFLRSNGDGDTFYDTLKEGGVSRQRLESFERPITAAPDFYPDKKDGLIADFEHFLGTLRSVHSATDLGTCFRAARPHFDDNLHQLADFVWHHREAAGSEVIPLLQAITELRRRITARFESDGALPDLLCLDIALEDFARTIIERNMQPEPDGDTLFEWLTLAMENFLLTSREPDLSFSFLQWKQIREARPLDRDLTLRIDSVLDRIERAVGDYAHTYQILFQEKAEALGESFQADPWTIRLFSEEVMRAGLVFVLSILSRRLRRFLRGKARLPSWQPVSRGGGKGRLRVMDSLDPVQGRRFDPPVIIVCDRIRGDEDLPEGTLAVLTLGSVDVVSHLAIRARNQGVLLATCYDEEIYEKLKSSDGRLMQVEIDRSGDVRLEPADESAGPSAAAGRPARSFEMKFREPPEAPYALTAGEFREELVGGKSLHLTQLQGKLPGWIHLPPSAALPFGTFKKVLETEVNREARERYQRLLARVDEAPEVVQELHRTVMELAEPEDLAVALREVMEKTGLAWPEKTERVWECIRGVWASKWNDRAYWNRKARGFSHEHLLMAVLIQEVVPAEYAYIIHTAHPFTDSRDEVYVEAVPGLGETLAGNYPGRAFSFTWHKKNGGARVLTYPSKSIGLYGGGLIFRSDSNAEDLAGYAGAGLYSSLLLNPPEEVHLNYTDEPLLVDKVFRKEFLSRTGKIGLLIEEVMGSPQDIEGAFTKGRYYVVQTRPQVGLDL